MVDISNEDVERYLNIIFTGREFIEINDRLFIFKQPDNMIKMRADLVYKAAYERAIESGMLPMEELEKLIKKRNIFTEKDEKEIERLTLKKEAQEVILSKTTRVQANRDRIKNIIAGIQEEIDKLYHKKSSKMIMAAEHKAEEERALYYCWSGVYIEEDEQEKRFWPDFKSLLNETDILLKDTIFIQYLKFKAGISTEIIRYIARHSLWRIRYMTSVKVSEPLFGLPTSQYTNDMLNLAYWSNFYQNVYEMMPKDRPSDSVIDDDKALDAYMTEYYRERTRQDATEREKSKFNSRGGRLSAFDKEEVIVTKANELYEDIKYDKPREAQMLKDRADINKRAKPRRKR